MAKFIPVSKMSKKAQKEYYAQKRSTWGELNPVTRTMPNGKGYNRKKIKQEDRRNRGVSQKDMICSFYICAISDKMFGKQKELGRQKP